MYLKCDEEENERSPLDDYNTRITSNATETIAT
jgi:hypothetical protein